MTQPDVIRPSLAVAPPDVARAEEPRFEPIEALFGALEGPLLGYALRLLGEREPAEDVVQEAFMKLHAQFDRVQEPRRWLYRTVHNLALNLRRQSGEVVRLVLVDPAGVWDKGAPRMEVAFSW